MAIYLARSLRYDVKGVAAFQVPFPYLDAAHVKVLVAATPLSSDKEAVANVDYDWVSAGVLQFRTPLTAFRLSIVRQTPQTQLLTRLTGGTLSSRQLQLVNTQLLYVAQEAQDNATALQERAVLVPEGETLGVLPPLEDRVGKFVGFGAEGELVATEGTGGDDLLRGELSLATGANRVGFGQQRMGDKLGRELPSVADRGAAGADTNETPAVAQAYADRTFAGVEAAGQGILRFPSGAYRLATLQLSSRAVDIAGDNKLSTVLRPQGPTDAVFEARYFGGGWDGPLIEGVTFRAAGGTPQGIGFRAGPEAFTPGAQFTTATTFRRANFNNLDKGLSRPHGSIGMWLDDCTFDICNFHIHSMGHPGSTAPGDNLMHAGCLFVSKGHMQSAVKASVYVDGKNVTGSGQVVFNSVIQEANPGWVYYFKDFGAYGGVPAPVVRDCWNEANYTAESVIIDGVARKPRYARIDNVGAFLFDNTPVGPLSLANRSSVITRDCDLTLMESLESDGSSTLVHERARSFSGTTFGVVNSIGAVNGKDATNFLATPWFTMPKPIALGRVPQPLQVSNAQAPFSFTGMATLDAKEVGFDPALGLLPLTYQVDIPSGSYFPPASFAIPAGKWIVVQYVARLIDGPACFLNLDGPMGRFGKGTIRDAQWRTYTALGFNPSATGGGMHLWHTGPSLGVSSLRIAGWAVTLWDTEEEALLWANSRLFPLEELGAYSVTNFPGEDRTLDGAAPVTPGATYSQADAQALANALDETRTVLGTLIRDLRKRGIV